MTVPADPRAKAIEAMARAICTSNTNQTGEGADWERLGDPLRDFYRADAEAALAALEEEESDG